MATTMRGFADWICVSSISDAVDAMSKNDIVCFIIDYKLADGNGINFAKCVRKNENYLNTPIILISSSLTTEIAFKAMKAGINQSLSKPIEPVEIKQIIARQIKNPTIHKVERTQISACCVRWEKDNEFFEYSLDTGRLIQSNSAKDTQEKMYEILKTCVRNKNNDSEGVINAKIVDYFLNIE
jgi:ActR/RegA family two-component response regulator